MYQHGDAFKKALLIILSDLGDAPNGIMASTSSGATSSSLVALLQRIESLSQQVAKLTIETSTNAALAASNTHDRIVYLGGATASGYAKWSLSTILSFAALMGLSASATALLLKTLGYNVDDVAWVTKSVFQSTTQSLRNVISKLGTSLHELREELSRRISNVERKVDVAHQELIGKMESEFGMASQRVDGVASEVNQIHQLVNGVQLQLGDLHSRVGYSNHGIYLLCQVVSSMPDSNSNGAWQELQRFVDQYNPADLNGSQPLPPTNQPYGLTAASAAVALGSNMPYARASLPSIPTYATPNFQFASLGNQNVTITPANISKGPATSPTLTAPAKPGSKYGLSSVLDWNAKLIE